MTQEELGMLVGVHPPYIAHIEKGTRIPDDKLRRRIFSALESTKPKN